MIPVFLIAAILACFEILLQVIFPHEQPPDPAPDVEDESENLPFGPATSETDN